MQHNYVWAYSQSTALSLLRLRQILEDEEETVRSNKTFKDGLVSRQVIVESPPVWTPVGATDFLGNPKAAEEPKNRHERRKEAAKARRKGRKS